MPESVDQTFSELERGFEVIPALHLPAQRAADQQDGEVADPGGDKDLDSLPGREGPPVLTSPRGVFPSVLVLSAAGFLFGYNACKLW